MNNKPAALREMLRCPIGWVLVEFDDSAIYAIEFLESAPRPKKPLKTFLPSDWATAIIHAASGQNFQCPPLSASGTEFQKAVWKKIQAIPAGQTMSYRELAVALGRPRAARAVGAACGANPIPLLIPCHRVLASGGKLGGFSGGLKIKKALLAAENSLWGKE